MDAFDKLARELKINATYADYTFDEYEAAALLRARIGPIVKAAQEATLAMDAVLLAGGSVNRHLPEAAGKLQAALAAFENVTPEKK